MSSLRERIADLFPNAVCFDEESYNTDMVNRILVEVEKEKDKRIKELEDALLDAAELIEGWSDIHKFDDWNRADKYRALANQYINKEG